jgi:hypothetical protein
LDRIALIRPSTGSIQRPPLFWERAFFVLKTCADMAILQAVVVWTASIRRLVVV